MKVSIIGSGALGKTYGGLLALAGHDVHFLVRSDYAELKKAGYFKLAIKDLNQTLTVNTQSFYTQASDLPPSDLVIIALKTSDNINMGSLLASCVKNNTIIVIVQNGIGSEEWISQFTGECPIVCAIATIGAGRGSALEVDISFLGNLKCAPYRLSDQHACVTVKQAFEKAPVTLPITLHDNYREIRWFKLAWNIPFGSLSIIFDQPTNSLAGNEPYQSLVYRLIDEIILIAKADGVNIPIEHCQQWVQFTQNSGHYFPTLYRDYHEGKTIEKAYIFDNVLAIAKKYQCNAPLLTLIERNLSLLLELRD